MTTALLPARHGSFVIYRPLRFHVIQIFPLAFSKRLRGPIDRSRGYFSIPLSIVSLVKIYPLHGRRQVSPHGVSSTLEVSPFVPYLRIFRIYPSRRSYRHSSMMKTENLRGDPFFQRSAIAWNRSVYDRFELVISNQLKTSPSFKMTIKYESVNAAGSLRIQAQFALIRMNY